MNKFNVFIYTVQNVPEGAREHGCMQNEPIKIQLWKIQCETVRGAKVISSQL